MKKLLLLLLLIFAISCKSAYNNMIVNAYGVAKNHNQQPVIAGHDGTYYYLEGIDTWTEADIDKKVTVTGKLTKKGNKRIIKEARVIGDGKEIIKKAHVILDVPKLTDDCASIALILKTPEIYKFFQFDKKGENIKIYMVDFGNLNNDNLCDLVIIPNGQYVTFAKADFEVNLNDNSFDAKFNSRLVVWKENNKYHFFDTETNQKFSASVKNNKVIDISFGVF